MPPTGADTGTPASIRARDVAHAVAIDEEPLLIVTCSRQETIKHPCCAVEQDHDIYFFRQKKTEMISHMAVDSEKKQKLKLHMAREDGR